MIATLCQQAANSMSSNEMNLKTKASKKINTFLVLIAINVLVVVVLMCCVPSAQAEASSLIT